MCWFIDMRLQQSCWNILTLVIYMHPYYIFWFMSMSSNLVLEFRFYSFSMFSMQTINFLMNLWCETVWPCMKSVIYSISLCFTKCVFGFMEVGGKWEVRKLIFHFPCLFWTENGKWENLLSFFHFSFPFSLLHLPFTVLFSHFQGATVDFVVM